MAAEQHRRELPLFHCAGSIVLVLIGGIFGWRGSAFSLPVGGAIDTSGVRGRVPNTRLRLSADDPDLHRRHCEDLNGSSAILRQYLPKGRRDRQR